MLDDPYENLDSKKLSFFHWKSLITTGMGVFTDGYDLSSIGIVLPLVLVSFGIRSLTGIESSLLAGSALIGAVVGALIFGILSNGGRKRFYGLDVTIMAVAAVLQIFAANPLELILIRTVLGIGVGADYVLSPMIMGEHANSRDRGKIIALGFGLLWGFGATVAAVVYLGLHGVVSDSILWRIVLAAGSIPAVAVIYLRRKMPETARYLGRIKGDRDGAAEVIHEISGRSVDPSTIVRDSNGLRYYLRKQWKVFLSASVLWFLFDMVAYSGILFGPSLIAGSLGLNSGDFQLLMEGLFVVPGGLIALSLIDKRGRKPLQIAGFIGMAVALVSFGMYKHLAGVLAVPAIALVLYGSQNLFQQAGPGSVSASGMLGIELAPTKIRGTIQALTVASGRMGATVSTFIFPYLFGVYGESFAVYFLGSIALVASIVTLVGIPETARKGLEKSSGETLQVPEITQKAAEAGGGQ